MTASLGECLEAAAGFGQQLIGHRQIALSSVEVLVTQVGRQLGKQIIQVGTRAIPGRNPMDGSRMPEIMQARLIASASLPPDAGNRTQAPECCADRRVGQGRAVRLAEQQVPAVSR